MNKFLFGSAKQRKILKLKRLVILKKIFLGVLSVRQCMDADNLHKRLKKIMGQVNAIDRMIDEDVPCENILMQVNAAKGALHKVGQIILEGHLNHCVKEGIEHGDVDKTIRDFAKAIEHFSRLS